jgi:hypothetical protein
MTESEVDICMYIWHLKMEYPHEFVLCSGLVTGGLFLNSGTSQLEDLGASANTTTKTICSNTSLFYRGRLYIEPTL